MGFELGFGERVSKFAGNKKKWVFKLFTCNTFTCTDKTGCPNLQQGFQKTPDTLLANTKPS